jgi:hypothetical protein
LRTDSVGAWRHWVATKQLISSGDGCHAGDAVAPSALAVVRPSRGSFKMTDQLL